MPLPIRSENRIASTCIQFAASPTSGRASAASEYPTRMSGLRRRARSDHAPESIFMSEAVASATPSIRPSAAGPAFRLRVRKSGRSGKIMSEDTSVRNETQPSVTTPGFSLSDRCWPIKY